jgi:NhaP-type Na+/H+ or K+/H+ antiporter
MKAMDLLVQVGLGVLLSIAFVFVYQKLSLPKKSNWTAWATAVASILLMVFSFAWAYASIVENEAQAAWMGLFVFGFPGLLAGVGALRLMKLATK